MNLTKTEVTDPGVFEFTIDGKVYRCQWISMGYTGRKVEVCRLDNKKFIFWTSTYWNHIWTDNSKNYDMWDIGRLSMEQTAKFFLSCITGFLSNTELNPENKEA